MKKNSLPVPSLTGETEPSSSLNEDGRVSNLAGAGGLNASDTTNGRLVSMKFKEAKKLGELAKLPYSELVGEGAENVTVDGVNTADCAEPGDIVWAESKEAIDSLSSSGAAAAIIPSQAKETPIPAIRHPLPKLVFGMLLKEFVPIDEGDGEASEVHPEARVDSAARICGGAKVGAGSVIKAGAVIGRGATVGEGCQVGYNSVIDWGCQLGNRVIVHSGTVIGTDGFGYVQKPCDDDPSTFESLKIPHAGIVIVEDDVEIGSNVCIDRGMLKPTWIGKGTKIDNLVQIAHNCEIGRHNIIISFAGISGSTKTGKNVIMAGQVGVADHTTIGDGAILMAGTKVAGEIQPQAKVIGYPPLPRSDFWKWTSCLMDVTLVKRILKSAQSSSDFEEFKAKMSELKPLGWPFKK